MYDIAAAYNRYKFLGYEFLTWLWYLTEKDRELFRKIDPETVSLDLGNRIVLENQVSDIAESVTIKGDDAGLEEGIMALRKGAVVTEMNLVYKAGDHEWRFSVKGESLHITNLKIPETGALESRDDIEGIVLEKLWLYEKVVMLIDRLFGHFIHLRLSAEWQETVVPQVKQWIYS